MLIDINQIPYEEIGPNSILVVRMPAGFTFSDGDKDMIDNLTRGLREKVHASVSVLIMRHDTEVFCVSEEVMNQNGWYRRLNAKTQEDSPAS